MVASSLWMSKARYCLHLCGSVRTKDTDPCNTNLHNLQIQQNKMMRVILNKKFKDQTSAAELTSETGFLSINQINAQIKLTEVWKSQNIPSYPIKYPKEKSKEGLITRGKAEGKLIEFGKSTVAIKSAFGDSTRLWNSCPDPIKNAKSLYCAKKEIRAFIKTLPI